MSDDILMWGLILILFFAGVAVGGLSARDGIKDGCLIRHEIQISDVTFKCEMVKP